MKNILITLTAILASLTTVYAANGQYDVRTFGAVGDGVHIDSPAINAALEQAARDGGGTVVLPQGTYLSYSLHLQSNVTLRIEKGATLKTAPVTDTQGYDEAEPNESRYQDFGHSHWHNSLLWGDSLHHVTIEGEGLIDGTDVLSRGEPRRGYMGMPQANKALALRDCHHVTIRDVSFLACGHFALLLTGVDDLLIENVTADTNRDGFDIDCCERVVIRGCRVNTVNDDAIVLKCSYALGWAKPTEHVLIEDCEVSGYDVGSLLDGTRTTHTLKAPDGAPMEDIRVSHLTMNDICNSPIYIRLGDRMRGPSTLPPSSVKDIRISHVRVTDADCRYACLIAGLEGHPVRDVRISDLTIGYRGGITLDDVAQQRGCNPFFYEPARKDKSRGVRSYPEPSAHGLQPAWGFSISHAEDITLRRVRLSTATPDERPWLYENNVKRLKMHNLKAQN